jgi:hypothetical protein
VLTCLSRNCRGRLWRSEQEVIPSVVDEESAKALRDRQRRRKPCTCDPSGMRGDRFGVINTLSGSVDRRLIWTS